MRTSHETITARKLILKELVEKGTTAYDDLVRSVQNLPEFKNLRALALYKAVTQYYGELGFKFKQKRGGKNIPDTIKQDRKLTIQQLLETGITDYDIMARHLQNDPAFCGLSIHGIVLYLRRHAQKNTVCDAGGNMITARTATVKPQTVRIETPTSSLDAILQSPQFRASVQSLRLAEYDRMVSLLRPLWQELETEFRALVKVKQDLDLKVSELENHRCPNPDEKLQEENSQLKERISFLERRVNALSQLTKPRLLNENHIAISAQGR